MALGMEVSKGILDMKASEAVLQLRSALDKAEAIAKWLANSPKVGTVDPLVTEFNYTEDEAYVLRVFFESVDGIRISNSSLIDIGRKMTGLE